MTKIWIKDQTEFVKYQESLLNKGTRHRKTMQIEYFWNWLDENGYHFESILNVPSKVFRDYFIHLNSKDIQQIVKRKYRGALKDFISWMIKPRLADGEEFKTNYDIIFSADFVLLDQGGETRQEEPLTRQDVLDCIAFFRTRNQRDYFIICLLAYTGMRIGGALNLQIENIDFEKRMIKTQEKKTKAHTGVNTYFLPKIFVNGFKSYILELKSLHPEQKLVFPFTRTTILKQLKKWRKSVHPHQFRDALNSRWLELGLHETVQSVLLNQKPKSVNARNYTKFISQDIIKSMAARLDYYDRYFPYDGHLIIEK